MARTRILRAFGLQIPCCRSLVLSLFCFCFFFVLVSMLPLKPPPFVRSFFDMHACAPTATLSCLTTGCALFLFLRRRRFFRVFLYHCCFLFVWRVCRTLFPPFWVVFFYLVTAGLIFYFSAYVRIQSINQTSIM